MEFLGRVLLPVLIAPYNAILRCYDGIIVVATTLAGRYKVHMIAPVKLFYGFR